jgi:hypothetical protein
LPDKGEVLAPKVTLLSCQGSKMIMQQYLPMLGIQVDSRCEKDFQPILITSYEVIKIIFL